MRTLLQLRARRKAGMRPVLRRRCRRSRMATSRNTSNALTSRLVHPTCRHCCDRNGAIWFSLLVVFFAGRRRFTPCFRAQSEPAPHVYLDSTRCATAHVLRSPCAGCFTFFCAISYAHCTTPLHGYARGPTPFRLEANALYVRLHSSAQAAHRSNLEPCCANSTFASAATFHAFVQAARTGCRLCVS